MRGRLRAGVALVAAMVWALTLAACTSGGGGSDDSDASADVDAFSFESLTADYTLTRADDGTSRMRVVEVFVADFPDTDQNRGMRRLLPEEYNGQPLAPRVISVTDENGAARPVETDSEDGTLGILTRGEEYLHGRQTFVFTYDLENVAWTFPDTGQEFYWDVNGVDWAQPFGRITARLHVDDDLADALAGRQACYAGVQDADTPCADLAVEDGGRTIVATAEDVQPYETLSLAVGFEDGTFTMFDRSYFASPFGWLQAGAMLLLLGAVAWCLRNRRRYLSREPGRPTIVAEFTPPADVDALESAVLLGKTSAAIPAEVLEQAVVGSIRIVEGERSGWGGKAKLQAELVDPALADRDGRMLLDGLFPDGTPGEVYVFGSSDTRFSSVAQKILSAAGDDLKARGMYREVPLGVRLWPGLAWLVSAFLVVLFGVLAIAAFVHPLVPALLLVVTFASFFVVIFTLFEKPLTARGAEVRDHLAGLKQFIAWAEADRIRTLQSPTGAERRPVATDDPRAMLHLYEQLLPYAVVFGQEKQWSAHLAVLYAAVGVSAPVWYVGSGAFDASSFAAGIGTLSSSAASSSSTSGGSAGGGGAGGGGGGGGGGGA